MSWSWRLLRAGAFKLDAGAMFGLVPKPVWSRHTEPDEHNRIPLNTNCLLLQRDDHLVLIETGIGNKSDDKTRKNFAMQDRSILDSLAEANTDPADITDVIVTHLHFDHAGGLTRKPDSGTGDPVSTFPNATIHTQQSEWDDALANKSTMHSTYLREHLDPIGSQIRTSKGQAEPIPGITVTPLPGHTWGQQGVSFTDAASQRIVFPADLMPTAKHAPLTYNMAYDMLPYENMLQKQAFLKSAAEENWLIILDHEPGDPLVRVVPNPKRPSSYMLVPDAGPA